MKEDRFVPPEGAFTRTVPIRFSHCDPAGIVYFPHYFDMFNGLIEDWYTEQLGVDYAKLILNDRYGFPFVHIETDFKLPSRMGENLNLTLLLHEDRTLFTERCHCRSPSWCREITSPLGNCNDVVRDATESRVAARFTCPI